MHEKCHLGYTRFMTFTTLIIDLDDTVYPSTSGVWLAIRERIDEFIRIKFNVTPEKAVQLRDDLFIQYGTTMRGLQVVYHLNEEEYLQYVHDVPLERLIRPNARLKQLLLELPYRKVILTNADRRHALRVMGILGITDCFEQIIDVQALAPYCKPMPEAFEIVLKLLDEVPQNCALIEDSSTNLATAKKMGFYTIRVGGAADCDHYDAQISSILELAQVIDKDRV